MLCKDKRQRIEIYKELRKLHVTPAEGKKRMTANVCQRHRREAMQNSIGGMYRGIKTLERGYQARINLCKNENGQVMGEEDRILERWAEFYGEKHNEVEAVHERDSIVKQIVESPSIQEVKEVIARLKCNEMPGSDSIQSEVFRHGGQILMRSIHELVTCIWEQ
ncbi:uncharacterized protein LOC142317548 [Lycorma delicatula]|uniref:uncharacterized protein LOC142317548 n=1 Tax=Lycorma delicatula TaxID=130591 RepID=UPI003F50FEDD